MTISTVASNYALSALIESYDGCFYTPEKNKQCAEAWAKALAHFADAAQEFLDDSARLEAFINGKG